MEFAGLAVSLPPLVSLCLECLERVRDFRDYKASSLQLNTRFELAKTRLKQWARAVGIVDGNLVDPHHPLLDQPEVKRAVGLVLNCLLNNFGGSIDDADVSVAQRHRQAEDVPPGWKPVPRSNSNLGKYGKSGRAGKNAMLWATGHKAAFTEQVDIFEILVERLYEVVPLDDTERAIKLATEAAERIQLTQDELLALVKKMHQDAMYRKIKNVNEWLDAPSVDQDLEQHVKVRLRGTCDWLVQNDAYRTWGNDDFPESHAKLFWLCAPPGHGKTVLSATLVQNMTSSTTWPVAYFFSSPHVQAGCSPHDILRSWIAQLARADDFAFELVYGQMVTSSALKSTKAEVWKLFQEVLLVIDGCTLVLDGYDEFPRSGETRKDFLHQLKERVIGTQTRVFISSRPEDDIDAELGFPNTVPGLSFSGHRITLADLKDDIVLYSKSTVADQLPKKDQAFQEELANQMVSKSDGMFLWIKLQKDRLRDGRTKKMLREVVDKMPDGLARSYDRTWNDIMEKSDEDRRRAVEILRWACFATRPLTVEEMTEALIHERDTRDSCKDDMPDEIDDSYIDGEIKGLCSSLVEIRKDPTMESEERPAKLLVHLVHVSAREFLISQLPVPSCVSIMPSEALEHAAHHMHLAEVCLRYINCDESWESVDVDSSDDQSFFKNRFMKYAATRWLTHCQKAKLMSDEYKRLTSQFFAPDSPHFVKWAKNDLFYRDEWTPRQDEAGLNARLYLAILYELSHIVDQLHTSGKLDLSTTTFLNGSALSMAVWKPGSAFDQLIAWGADINIKCGRDGSALGAAAMACNLERARVLLNRGADPKIRDWKGRPVLTLACWKDDLNMMRLLLDHNIDPDDCDVVRSSPLFWCIDRKNLETVKLLLDRGASVVRAAEDGISPLYLACCYDNVDVVNLLLEQGADVLQRTKSGHTPLDRAAYLGNTDIVRSLLKRQPDLLVLAGQSGDGLYPIHNAAISGSLETVKVLVEYGADIHQSDKDGETPLYHVCCGTRDAVEVVEFLLDNGADIMYRNEGYWTPLHAAAFNGLPMITKVLLDRGADMLAELDDEGMRAHPVHCAAGSGSIQTLQVLLDHGADVNDTSTSFGATPLIAACTMTNKEMISFLVDKGADLSAESFEGLTPWLQACMTGDLEIVKFFLDRGGDLWSQRQNGWTPLHSACVSGNIEVVNLVLGRGGTIMQEAEYNRTPLHMACQSGSKMVVSFLIERGAGIRQPEGELERTPLHLACCNETDDMVDIVQLLLEAGAEVTQLAHNGFTALHCACGNTNVKANEVVTLLLKRGANPSQATDDGLTPLHYAAWSGNLEIIRILLETGVQVPGQATPAANAYDLMHCAVDSGDADTVQFLIEQGLSISTKARLDRTPLSQVVHSGNDLIIEKLINAGADIMTPLLQGYTLMELIEDDWPKHEKIKQWRAKVRFQVSPSDREIWIRHEISAVAQDALLVEKYPDREDWSLFTYLTYSFWRLGAGDDFIFANQQTVRAKDVSGQFIHTRGCDNCDQYPIVGERWVCFTCPVPSPYNGVDFCGSCKARLPDIENAERQACANHDLILVSCYEGDDIKEEDQRAKDPEVRMWLESVVERYTVDGPMPPLVPVESVAQRFKAVGKWLGNSIKAQITSK